MLRSEPVLHTAHIDAYSRTLAAMGLRRVDERTFAADRGRVALARLPDGHPDEGRCEPRIVETPASPPSRRVALQVLAIWLTPDPAPLIEDLRARGARPRLSADDGVWTDFALDDGLVAVHRDEAQGTELAFEYSGDLDALADRLHAADITVVPLDENYARTLHLPGPGGIGRLVVNERQRDLYGFTRHLLDD